MNTISKNNFGKQFVLKRRSLDQNHISNRKEANHCHQNHLDEISDIVGRMQKSFKSVLISNIIVKFDKLVLLKVLGFLWKTGNTIG